MVSYSDHKNRLDGTSPKPARDRRARKRAAMDRWSSAKLCDVANLLLGSSLFFSPWLFGLPPGVHTTVGLFIAVLAVAALAAFAVWEDWFSLIAGLWLIGLPWLLGFEDSDAITICVVTGTIVAALASFKVWLVHRGDRRISLGS